MDVSDEIVDGMVIKISDNCWAEYVKTESNEFNRRAWRLSDRFGRGVLIDSEFFEMFGEILKKS